MSNKPTNVLKSRHIRASLSPSQQVQQSALKKHRNELFIYDAQTIRFLMTNFPKKFNPRIQFCLCVHLGQLDVYSNKFPNYYAINKTIVMLCLRYMFIAFSTLYSLTYSREIQSLNEDRAPFAIVSTSFVSPIYLLFLMYMNFADIYKTMENFRKICFFKCHIEHGLNLLLFEKTNQPTVSPQFYPKVFLCFWLSFTMQSNF